MTDKKVMELLSMVDVFTGLEDHELELLSRVAQEVSLPSDTIIFRQGDRGDKMYLVTSGIIEIWKTEGHDIKGSRLARLKQGEIFGEMALFDKEPRSATAITSQTSPRPAVARPQRSASMPACR